MTYDPWALINSLKKGTPLSTPFSGLQIPATGYPTYGLTNPNTQVLGAGTTNPPAAPTNLATLKQAVVATNPQDQSLAQAGLDVNIERIKNLFNAGKEQVAQESTNAVNRFNDIMAAVDAYKSRAGTLKENAGQEITNAASDIMHGNATNARNLVGKATGQARSLGLGLSSRMNLGQGLLQNLESTQGNVMAKQGEQNRANDVLYQGRIDTGDQQASDALTAKNAALSAADLYGRTNVENYGTNLEGATTNFASMLNNIVNYNRSLQAMATPNAGSLTQMQPDMSGIVNTINTVLGGLPATTIATGANPATNLASPTSLLDLLKRQGLYAG